MKCSGRWCNCIIMGFRRLLVAWRDPTKRCARRRDGIEVDSKRVTPRVVSHIRNREREACTEWAVLLEPRSPPSARARRRLSARPRPTPVADCAASWADLENGRNKRRIARGGKPGPWSRTVNASHRPAGASSRWMRRSVTSPRTDRIIHQVREDLIDHGNVHAHVCLAIDRADDEFHAGLPGARGQARDQSVEQFRRRDDLVAVGRAASLEPGERQDVLDQMAQPVSLGSAASSGSPLRIGARTIPSSSISV